MKQAVLIDCDSAGRKKKEKARPTPAALQSLVCTMTSLLHHLVINYAPLASSDRSRIEVHIVDFPFWL